VGWKVVHLSRPCKIFIKNENLVLNFTDTNDEVKVTLNDIDFILFDNTQFSITGKSLELLAKNNIATLFIDEEFHPSSILTPYHQHSTMYEVANTQIALSEDFKGKVWQEIIKVKLKNQSDVLHFFQNPSFEKIDELIEKVEHFDISNQEAQGARVYWKNLFLNKHFKREQGSEDVYNSMLNYGYAILRACMARSLSASGLLPIFGIWHQNRYNAFGLADDLMETFRPIVDIYIKLLKEQKYPNKTIFDIQLKREIVALLNYGSLVINGGISSLSSGVELYVRNYKRAMMSENISYIFHPTLNEKFFRYECL